MYKSKYNIMAGAQMYKKSLYKWLSLLTVVSIVALSFPAPVEAALSTPTALASMEDATGGATHTTTAFDVSEDDLIVVCASVSNIGDPGTLSITDGLGGLTWTEYHESIFTMSGLQHRMACYTATATSDTNGAITINTTNGQRWAISVFSVTGQDLSTPVAQSNFTQDGTGGFSTSATTTLASTPASDSMVVAFASMGSGTTAHTAGTGFTAIHTLSTGSFNNHFSLSEYDLDNASDVAEVTWTTNSTWGIIALEIQAASGGGGDPGGPATGTSVIKTIIRAFSTFRAGVTFK